MNTTKWKEHKVIEHKDVDNVFIIKDKISHMQKKKKRKKIYQHINNGYVSIILTFTILLFLSFAIPFIYYFYIQKLNILFKEKRNI